MLYHYIKEKGIQLKRNSPKRNVIKKGKKGAKTREKELRFCYSNKINKSIKKRNHKRKINNEKKEITK